MESWVWKSIQEMKGTPSWRRTPVVLVALMGLALSVAAFSLARHDETEHMETTFEGHMGNMVAYLNTTDAREMSSRIGGVLRLIKAEGFSAENVDREGFAVFEKLGFSTELATVSVEWSPRVLHGDRKGLEQVAHEEGFANFELRERINGKQLIRARARSEYFPVQYAASPDGNTDWLGIDLAANPLQREAMGVARDSGGTAIFGCIPFCEMCLPEMVFRFFVPVYAGGITPATLEERREALQGYLSVSSRSSLDQLGTTVPESIRGMELAAHSAPNTLENSPLLAANVEIGEAGDSTWKLHFESGGGTPWVLLARPLPAFVKGNQTNWPWKVLGMGLFLTALGAGYAIRAQGRSARVEQLVHDRTRELEQSEERYRLLFNQSPVAIAIHDGNDILFGNAECAKLLGFDSPEAILGTDVTSFLYSEEIAAARKRYPKVRESRGKSELNEVKVKRRDGRDMEISYSESPVTYKGSAAMQVAFYDVTDRNQAQKKVRSNQRRYELLAKNITDIIMMIDMDLRVQYLSPSGPAMLGYTYEEARKLTLPEVADPQTVAEAAVFLRDTLQHEAQEGHRDTETPISEMEVFKKDGSKIWIESKFNFLRDANGKATGILMVSRDITERKRAEEELRQSEEQYRLLAENATDVIWTCDLRGRITYVSPSGRKLFGFEDDPDAKVTLFEILTPESMKLATKTIFEELEAAKNPSCDPKRTRTVEYECRTREGGCFWIETKSAMLRNAEGQIIGLLGVSREISERKAAEQERTSLEDQLRQSQKLEAIGTLAGGIAHDFNNLLTGILGYSNMLKMNFQPKDPTYAGLDVIERAADRARDLTSQLLGFARKGKMQNAPIDLDETVRDVVNLLERTIDKSIQIQQDLAGREARINGDPGQMHQVILNLAVNAADAMPDGGTLTFSTEPVTIDEVYAAHHEGSEPGRYLQITVTDTGSGIPPETREHIFEPFFSTKEQGKGSGMGLAMVYGIIKNHSGSIQVYSEEGLGSSFKVLLPLVEDPCFEEREQSSHDEMVKGAGRILVVDDEEIVRTIVRDMLLTLGYEVIAVADGQEAVEYYETSGELIDLVLLDMIMPRMNGRECFEALRKLNPEVRTVLSTGYSREGAAQDILEQGVGGFVQKPYRMDQLSRVIADVLK